MDRYQHLLVILCLHVQSKNGLHCVSSCAHVMTSASGNAHDGHNKEVRVVVSVTANGAGIVGHVRAFTWQTFFLS